MQGERNPAVVYGGLREGGGGGGTLFSHAICRNKMLITWVDTRNGGQI